MILYTQKKGDVMDYDTMIDIDFDKKMHKIRDNGLLLSDEQIEILKKYDINYLQYNNISSLIYELEEILNEEYNEELDKVSSELSEFNYYNNTNK